VWTQRLEAKKPALKLFLKIVLALTTVSIITNVILSPVRLLGPRHRLRELHSPTL
jgi:hypothetical protein